MLDWTPPARIAATRLEGRHVLLEPLAVDHAQPLYDALVADADESTWTYLPVPPPVGIEGMRALVAAQVADPAVDSVAVRPAGGEVGGRISWSRVDPAHGCAEISWVVLGPGLRRTAAATEAVHLLLRQAFDLGYRRVEWKCDALNEPSRRAAARLGFTFEGRFRQHRVVKGLNRDTDWFAMLDHEWPAIRAAHEAWLAPGNFDAAGHQRTPLAGGRCR